MSYRICAVTSTRADYGLLRNTLLRLNDNCDAELDLVVTGTHLLSGFGSTKSEIEYARRTGKGIRYLEDEYAQIIADTARVVGI